MTRANDVLQLLETQATHREEDYRYEPYTKRLMQHVVDATPWLPQDCPWMTEGRAGARIVLDVVVAYSPFYERLAFYGNRQAAINKHLEGQMAFGMWYEGQFRRISREQAVELLTTRDLPAGVTLAAPERDYGNPADPFEGIEEKRYIGPEMAASRRISRLVKEAGQY